jgi:hypothetical protein
VRLSRVKIVKELGRLLESNPNDIAYFDDDSIRIRDSHGNVYCPLTYVCARLTDNYYGPSNFLLAINKLNISMLEGLDIVGASDNYSSNIKYGFLWRKNLRNDLIDAIKLGKRE